MKLREREKEEKIEMVRDMIAMLSDVNLFSTVMRLGLALLLGGVLAASFCLKHFIQEILPDWEPRS